MLDETQTAEQKLLARYQGYRSALKTTAIRAVYLSLPVVLSRSWPPYSSTGRSAKKRGYDFTHELLTTLEVDDPAMVESRWNWCWKAV